MKQIDRKLLLHLVDIVWGDALQDESVPSTDHAKSLIQKAIERRRAEKYKPITPNNEEFQFECRSCGHKSDSSGSCESCGFDAYPPIM